MLKKKIIKALFILSIAFFNISLIKVNDTTNDNIECDAVLTLMDKSNSKSIFNKTISYAFELKNLSDTKERFIISSINILENTEQINRSKKEITKSNSIPLSASYSNKNNEAIEYINLNSGETYIFNVNLSTTKTTGFEKWNFTKVNITSTNCNTEVASKLLKTYVPNPNLR